MTNITTAESASPCRAGDYSNSKLLDMAVVMSHSLQCVLLLVVTAIDHIVITANFLTSYTPV